MTSCYEPRIIKRRKKRFLLNRMKKKKTRNRRALSPSRASPSQRAKAQSTKRNIHCPLRLLLSYLYLTGKSSN